MGPLIDKAAADAILEAASQFEQAGGRSLVTPQRCGPGHAFVSPGLIDVAPVPDRADVKHFGPLLQLIRVSDFEAAIVEANNTAFGLVAGLIGGDRDRYARFHRRVRAGLINWNRPPTAASSRLPFGEVGLSGNHRASGIHTIDYCTHPVASLETPKLTAPDPLPRGLSP
jgi:succinylglutamic semialdehyde dehydrogenase